MGETADAVWAFAELQAPDFQGVIWDGRTDRPSELRTCICLIDAIERVARTYVDSHPLLDHVKCLKQAAVDIAVLARRGDLATYKRNKIGGKARHLGPRAWARWLNHDRYPEVVRACSFATVGTRGNVQEWWVYVETEGLEARFPATRRKPPPKPIPPLLDGRASGIDSVSTLGSGSAGGMSDASGAKGDVAGLRAALLAEHAAEPPLTQKRGEEINKEREFGVDRGTVRRTVSEINGHTTRGPITGANELRAARRRNKFPPA